VTPRKVLHHGKVYDSVVSAADGIGVHKNTILRALKSGNILHGDRVTYFYEPEKRNEPQIAVKVSRGDGPLIRKPITHGIGILRR